MPKIEPFIIDSEEIADDYLEALLSEPPFRSMEVVEERARHYIRDPKILEHFRAKARWLLSEK